MRPDHADLSGVRAVVTGATSGLGAAMAEALLGAGATVAYASRPGPRLEESVARQVARGLAAHALPLDVRDPASVDGAPTRAGELLGGVDVVVNNAGIGMRTVNPAFLDQPMAFFDVPVGAFLDVVATNLTGYFLVARAFAPLLVGQGHGRFVNISMNHETMRRRGFVPYGPARAGAEALSHIMAEDLRPYGVASNILLPGGATDTGMIPDGMPAERRAALLPASVMGPPVVFLASAQAEGVTGERIVAARFDQWLAEWSARPAP
jgi:NAD(P)-dependent dehydrogenase (short-subunit alcohol dehydrogenase family)